MSRTDGNVGGAGATTAAGQADRTDGNVSPTSPDGDRARADRADEAPATGQANRTNGTVSPTSPDGDRDQANRADADPAAAEAERTDGNVGSRPSGAPSAPGTGPDRVDATTAATQTDHTDCNGSSPSPDRARADRADADPATRQAGRTGGNADAGASDGAPSVPSTGPDRVDATTAAAQAGPTGRNVGAGASDVLGDPGGSGPDGTAGRAGGDVGGVPVPDSGTASAPVVFDQDDALRQLRAALPASMVPMLAVVDTLPTRTSGKVDRAALPWPLPGVGGSVGGSGTAVGLTPTEAWLAGLWGEVLGAPATGPDSDFFAAGGGSLAAAQLVSRIRTRHPSGSVSDIYQNPKLGALARTLDESRAETSAPRTIEPVPRRTGIAQILLMLPLLTVAGLRWGVAVAAANNVLAHLGSYPWAPTVSWWWVLAGWLLCVSPPGRIAIAAGGARLLLRGLRPGTYARGGGVHLRLWTAERLAELSGATGLSGSWLTHYARALGAQVGPDVDLHTLPPVTGMLKLGRGSAIEPEVDLSGHWLDGDRLHLGRIRVGAGATVGARSTLFPGARIGKRAEIDAGSAVTGAVPDGRRWAG
ncbi:phosphopantetheine-binding protein, partial [Streptomyces sp. SID1121]|uniref:phosphopantetheine-binding protein n=1 Tax=Streptomyces sp. SID1121 TaxID=3425888 RepID=UPI00405749B3